MTDDGAMTYTGAFEGAALPPPDAEGNEGFSELVRLWYKDKEDTHAFNVQLRPIFEKPLEWSVPIAMVVQTVTKLYSDGKIDDEQARMLGATILLKTAEVLGFNDLIEDYARKMVSQGAGIASHQHVNSIPLPPEITHDPEAMQLLSIWQFPVIEQCEDCGERHDAQTYVGGATEGIPAEDMGRLLAEIATNHATHCEASDGSKMKILADVQKAFHDRLNAGVARA